MHLNLHPSLFFLESLSDTLTDYINPLWSNWEGQLWNRIDNRILKEFYRDGPHIVTIIFIIGTKYACNKKTFGTKYACNLDNKEDQMTFGKCACKLKSETDYICLQSLSIGAKFILAMP